MKRLTIILLALQLGLVAGGDQPLVSQTQSGRTQRFASPEAVPEGLSASDWSSIRQQYEQHRHAAFPVEGGYQARNPGQHWQTHFDGRGFVIQPDTAQWRWGLELRNYGFPSREQASTGQPRVSATGQRVAYDWDDNLQEWFVNDPRGLEHGFTLRRRPPGAGNCLFLNLAVRGGLRPEVQADGRGVSFVAADGAAVLTYAGLAVLDADGRSLAAHFEPVAEGVRLAIDEREAAYPLTVDPLINMTYLKASNADEGDFFGTSVAVWGNTVVVGASNEDFVHSIPSYKRSGAAYVFVRNATTGSWSQPAYLKAAYPDEKDEFGSSVAVWGDTVVVGAPCEDGRSTGVNGNENNNGAERSGAAYVFERSGTGWYQRAYLKPSNTGPDDEFGSSVAVSGDTVVVGAPQEDSMNTDPTDDSAENTGAAYVFVRNGATWSQQAYLKASNASAFDLFGWSVAVSGDTVVVGAIGESMMSGAAYVFVRGGGAWSQQAYLKALNGNPTEQFGHSVSVSGDTLVVGAPFVISGGAGAAYVFARSGTTWSQQAYLTVSSTEPVPCFGFSVGVAGNTVVVGMPFVQATPFPAGAAYVFVRSGTTWSQQAYLHPPYGDVGDFFGTSVAVSGDTVVVGAPGEDSNVTVVNGDQSNNSAWSAGAAYVIPGMCNWWWLTPVQAGPGILLQFPFLPGHPCRLDRATDVTGAWSTIATSTAAEDGLVEFLDTNAPPSQAFYRAVSSEGQLCSRNVAGYVNLSLRSAPAGTQSVTNILANPLNRGDNHLNTILPLPEAYVGTTIYRWDPATQDYRQPIQFRAGSGWSSSDPNEDCVLQPGEAFVICPKGPDPLTVTFLGDVPQGNLVNPLPRGLSLKSSIVPAAGLLTSSLAFPAADGDVVRLFDPNTQQFNDPYRYDALTGWVWSNPDDPRPEEPIIPIGTGFWVQKAAATTWTRTFRISGDCSGCAPPFIAGQPRDRTVTGCSCVAFGVSTLGDAPLTYQWYKDGQPLAGANGPSFIKCPVGIADAGQYFVRVTNPCGTVDSSSATLTVQEDTTPTTVLLAQADCASNKVYLTFSAPLDPASGPDPGHYSLDHGASITNAVLTQPDTICLSTTPLAPGVTYTLDLAGLVDLCDHRIADTNTSFTCSAGPCLTVICPPDITTKCPANVPDLTALVTVVNHCQPQTALTITQTPLAGGALGWGTTPITVTVVDGGGHVATCQCLVTMILDASSFDWQWANSGVGTGIDTGQGVATDSAGNVFFTGYFDKAATFNGQTVVGTVGGLEAMFLAKYKSTGALLWVDSAGPHARSGGSDVAVDAAGNCLVTGIFQGVATFAGSNGLGPSLNSNGDVNLFVVKYDGAGNVLWANQAQNAGLLTGYPYRARIAVDANGAGLVTGAFSGTADFGNGNVLTATGSAEMFFAKYDASGNLVWVRASAGLGPAASTRGYGVGLDGDGNCYVSGRFEGAVLFDTVPLTSGMCGGVTGSDAFIAKYTPAGALLWAIKLGICSPDGGLAIGADAAGNSFVIGDFAGTQTFGNGATLTATTYEDLFVAKHTAAGSLVWVKAVPATGYGDIVVQPNGESLITASFRFTVNLGGTSLTDLGGGDVLVASLDADANYLWATQLGSAGDDVSGSLDLDPYGCVAVGCSVNSAGIAGTLPPPPDDGGWSVSDAFVAKFCPDCPENPSPEPCLLGIAWTPGALLYDLDPATGLALNPRSTGLAHPIGLEVADNGDVFAITQAPDNKYYRINRATGATTVIAQINWPMTEGDLALDPVTGRMYFTSQDTLYQMDLNGNNQTFIGPVLLGTQPTKLSGIAFNSGGQFFGIDTAGGVESVFELSSATGQPLLGTIRTISPQLGRVLGFDYDPANDTFYVADSLAAGNNRLYQLDVATGLATPAPNASGATFGFSGLAVAPCQCLPDLWMKDTMDPDLPEDFGAEPNTLSNPLWISRDIWVRVDPDTASGSNPGPDTVQYYGHEHDHQNPIYFNSTTPNYLYVKVRNRGCAASTGSELLRLYWADASVGVSWPSDWTEIDCNLSTPLVVDPYPLTSVIQPNQDYVACVKWVPPPPSMCANAHVCLLARIETLPAAPYGMAFAETANHWQNVHDNNNIVWKNMTVIRAPQAGGSVIVRNTLTRPERLTLQMGVPAAELTNHFLLHGAIFVDLGPTLLAKWQAGGQPAVGCDLVPGSTQFRITNPTNAVLGGMLFDPGEEHCISVDFQRRADDPLPEGTVFNYDIAQYAPLTDNAVPSVIGGMRYAYIDVENIPSQRLICGKKFNDSNQNGVWDSGEPGVPNWTIHLAPRGWSTVTDADGMYCFHHVPDGTYTLTETPQSGWVQTAPVGGSYTVTLSNAQSIGGLNFGNYPLAPNDCVQPPLNLAAWWPFDEPEGTTAAELVYANHGTHFNDLNPAAGKVAGALHFDGLNAYVAVADHPAINFPGGKFTVDFWINPDLDEESGTIVRKGSPSGDPLSLTSPGYHLFYDHGRLLAFFRGSGGTFQADLSSASPLIPPDQWTFVAVIVDLPANTASLYLQGALVQTTPLLVNFIDTSNHEPLIIGGYESGGDPARGFAGLLDELEFSNGELKPSDIQAIYQADTAGKCRAKFLGHCLLGIEFADPALLYDIDALTGLASNPRDTALAHPIGLEMADNGEVYAITRAPDNRYYRIDRTTGVTTLIKSMLTFLMEDGDIALNPAPTAARPPLYFTFQNVVLGMQLDGSSEIVIGSVQGTPTPRLAGIAFNNAGQLFAIDTAGSDNYVLELNPDHAQPIGAPVLINVPLAYAPLGEVAGLDFDPSTEAFYLGDRFALGNNRLFRLNVTTGDLTPAPYPFGVAFGFSGLAVAVAPRDRCPPTTYTLDDDFKRGTIVNLNHDPAHHQLQLNPRTTPLPYLAVACAGRGTVERIDVNTGEVVGEYLSAPDNMSRTPQRLAVDKYGNIWVGNRYEQSQDQGAVVRIGLIIGGTRTAGATDQNGNYIFDSQGQFLAPPFDYNTCVDRDHDGLIQTSFGLNNVLSWPNSNGADSDGGVSNAEDEAITAYTRVNGAKTLFVSVDCDNNVWTGGLGVTGGQPNAFQKLDGTTGLPLPGAQFSIGCGGYHGGLVDGNGVLWSGHGPMLYNPNNNGSGCTDWVGCGCLGGGDITGFHGIGINPLNGHIFVTEGYSTIDSSYAVREIDPVNLNVLTSYQIDGDGICVDGNGHIWIAAGNHVVHLAPDGSLVGNVTGFTGSRGVAEDSNGRIWVTEVSANQAVAINPNAGSIDQGTGYHIGERMTALTVDLGNNANPCDLSSDMTGAVLLGATCRCGFWDVIHEGSPRSQWGTVSWNADTPAGTSLTVEVRAAEDRPALPSIPFTAVANHVPFCGRGIQGRYLEVRVNFSGTPYTTDSPILYDLTVQCCPQSGCTPVNHLPTVDCPAPVVVCSGAASTVTLSATVSDADGHAILVSWREGTNPPYHQSTIPPGVPPSSGTVTFTHTYQPGPHVITLAVSDGTGFQDACNIPVSIGDITPPDLHCPPGITQSGFVGYVPDFLPGVTVSDNCTATPNLVLIQSPSPGTPVYCSTRTVSITATDEANNSSTCQTYYRVWPGITITEPRESAVFTAPTNIVLVAQVAKDAGPVQEVRFLMKGTVVGTATAAPYRVTVSIETPGVYPFFAQAVSPEGYRATSEPRQVVVNPAAPAPPAIISPPVSQTVCPGANVTFGVVATGTPPLSYQWYFNGAPIPDATGSDLTLNSVGAAQAGNYKVIVTNEYGSSESGVATLTVQSGAPPRLGIVQQGNQVLVSWPVGCASYVLEEAGSLRPPLWSPSTASITLVGNQYVATLPTLAVSKFYRLRY